MIDVAEPVTGISVAPTIVQAEVSHGGQLDRGGSSLPATVLLRLDRELNVLDDHGASLGRLPEYLERHCERVIPGLCVSGRAAADALSGFLTETGLEDAFIVSSDPDLVARVRKAVPLVRGVIDLRKRAGLPPQAIREAAGAALARVVLLPGAEGTRKRVEALQRLLLSVWISDDQPQDGVPAAARQFNLVASGANGIVTADPDGAARLLGSAFPQDAVSLVRKPFVIGHRGVPSLAPENTLVGARIAFDQGADMIENDVHLTRDGIVVIHHDDTLERTTTGEGALRDHTYTQLSSLLANRQFPDEYPAARIPQLREYLDSFMEHDMVHVIELKSPDPEVVRQTVALLREAGAESQAVFISFHPGQLQVLRELLPGASAGLLTGGQVDANSPLQSVRRVLEAVQPLAATYHPRATGITSSFLEAARHRGITTWPWTIRDPDSFIDLFLAGVNGITTDYSQWASGWICSVETPVEQVIPVGQTVRLSATAKHYGHRGSEVEPEVVTIHGHELVSVAGAEITGVRPGEAWYALRCWHEVAPGRGYFMSSAAARLRVSAD